MSETMRLTWLRLGALSFGALSFGALSFGALSFGPLSFGALSLMAGSLPNPPPSQVRLGQRCYTAFMRPTALPAGSLKNAIVGPSGTSILGMIV